MAFYSNQELAKYFETNEIREQSLDAEEVIFRLGDPVKRIHFVVKGEVRAETYLENGQPIVFFRAKEGQAIAEENLFLPNYLYSAIVSVPDTVIASVSRDQLLSTLHSRPAALDGFVTCLAQRYSDALMTRELVSIRSAEERLLMWLHWQLSRNTPSRTVDLTGRMGALGADLGLTREAVYRAFKSLEDAGTISRADGVITVLAGLA